MKFMIASDIHGSPLYCKQLLSRYQSEKADKLLLLGDLLYHGPRNSLPEEYSPVDVISMLNPLKSKILCVRGTRFGSRSNGVRISYSCRLCHYYNR